MEEPMPVFEQECSYDEENALLICNIKPILFNCRDLATASTAYVVPAFNVLSLCSACCLPITLLNSILRKSSHQETAAGGARMAKCCHMPRLPRRHQGRRAQDPHVHSISFDYFN
jgi:hypothetical protein